MTWMEQKQNKGIVKTFGAMIVALLTIVFSVLLIVAFVQRYYDLRVTISETENDRNLINLAQILLSSDKLVYSDGNTLSRAVLDKNKLDSLDFNSLKNEINFPSSSYSIIITDLENNRDFRFGVSTGRSRSFPISIRYPDGSVAVGKMTLYASIR